MATPYIYFIKLLWKYEENVMLGLNGEKEVKKNRKIPKGVTWSSKSKDRQYSCQTNHGQNDKKNYLQHNIT